jgi:multidrug efflux pump subunit AcrA (membrane-fusion protein)
MYRIVKFAMGTVVALALVGAFAVFVLQIPMPWKARAEPPKASTRPQKLEPIELVKDQPNTVMIPESVRKSLGIRQGGRDVLFTPTKPQQRRQLVMLGSTALDPARIIRMRARFAPCECVSINEIEERDQKIPSKTEKHEVRVGDEVTPGLELCTFFSADVGNKKNDLFEAIVQLRLDEIILKKAVDAGGSLPDIYLWTAVRNVDTDRSTVRRAKNTLLTWGIDADDVASVVQEANELKIIDGKRQEMSEKEMKAREDRWARVVLRTPDFAKRYKLTEKSLARLRAGGLPEELAAGLDRRLNEFIQFETRDEFMERMTRILGQGEAQKHQALLLKFAIEPAVVVERNLAKGEVVVDNTVNLYTLARIDQLVVYANCPEDDLKELDRLRRAGQLEGTVQTVGTEKESVKWTITDIGQLIDPNQHTAVIKGYIDNPNSTIRAGQFATATVELLPLEGVVEIPTTAVVEDGRQSVVFVQTDAAKSHYQMRRVEVLKRYEKTVFVRSTDFTKQEELTDDERKQDLLPRTALKATDTILTAGVLELKAAVTEKEAARRSQEAQEKK